MQKGREVDSTAAPRTGGTRRSSRRVGIVLHGAVQGRAMRFSQGLLKAVPLIGVLQREAWKRSEAKQRGWTKTPNGSEWWKNSDLWHVKASVKVSWWSWLCKVQFRAPESRSIQRRSLTGTSSLVWCMKDMKVLCGAHHLIRSEPPASREEKMRLMLCTKGLFQLQNFWFLRGWFGGLPDDETSTGDWSIIETKGVASESEFYVDFPGIVKFESEDFEIQKSQKQSIAHNSCHCWLFGPLKIQHVFLEIENKVLEVSATNSGVLENVFGKAHGTHFVRLKTCPLSIPYGRHLPSLTTRPGFMVASASRKTSIACWKKHGFCWGKKTSKKQDMLCGGFHRFPKTGSPSHYPRCCWSMGKPLVQSPTSSATTTQASQEMPGSLVRAARTPGPWEVPAKLPKVTAAVLMPCRNVITWNQCYQWVNLWKVEKCWKSCSGWIQKVFWVTRSNTWNGSNRNRESVCNKSRRQGGQSNQKGNRKRTRTTRRRTRQTTSRKWRRK